MCKISFYEKNGLSDFFDKLERRKAGTDSDVLKTVEDIITNVRKRGDTALLDYTLQFDKVKLNNMGLKVTDEEYNKAYEIVDDKLLSVIRNAKKNITDFHLKQKQNSWIDTEKNGVLLGQMITPLSTVGIYVPGGTAPLPSSVLMNAIPAKVAGVDKIVMCTPPGKQGEVDPVILVAAREAGVDSVFKVGGAQAIAAMAFGTETIPKVDKIAGPGNRFVATAKKIVFGVCDIDMVAGPSEVMIVADSTANSMYVAADLLSQAEHDVFASSILVTTSKRIYSNVLKEIQKQVEELCRKEIIKKSLEDYGAVILVDTLDEALELVKEVAPEHLELCVDKPFDILGKVRNAGAVFLGNWSPEPLGDYYAGPNHVLPTSGTARFFSPLGVSDFLRRMSVISYPEQALKGVAKDVIAFAESEGLDAHANSIRIRFNQGE